MARPRTQQPEEERTEAEVVAEQQEEAARAEERRAREAERAAGLKSVPEGALPPTEKQPRGGGDTQFARQWLLDNADSVLGHPKYVVAGALHLDESEYMTVAEARDKIERWLQSEITAPGEA